MIGSALRFPLDGSEGRHHFFVVTGALLATAIGLRIALGLYPFAVAILPFIAATGAVLVAIGTAVEAYLRPGAAIPGVRSLLWTGSVAAGIGVATLAGPLVFLTWTVLSYSSAGSSLESGTALFFLLGSTTALLAFLVATYLLPVLVARAVLADGPRKIYDGRRLRVALTAIPYLHGWSVGIGLAVLGSWATVTGITSTNLAGLLAVIAGGYCLLASVRVMGQGYAAVPGVDSG